jgi:hypothetical protein
MPASRGSSARTGGAPPSPASEPTDTPTPPTTRSTKAIPTGTNIIPRHRSSRRRPRAPPSQAPGAVQLSNGQTVNPNFLQNTGQTKESYGAALGLKEYKAEQGITGGVTASQLNQSLTTSPLTPAKSNYLNAMLASGALDATEQGQVQNLLKPPPKVVTSSSTSKPAAVGGKPQPKLVAPIPAQRSISRVHVAQVIFGHGARHVKAGDSFEEVEAMIVEVLPPPTLVEGGAWGRVNGYEYRIYRVEKGPNVGSLNVGTYYPIR